MFAFVHNIVIVTLYNFGMVNKILLPCTEYADQIIREGCFGMWFLVGE